MKLTKTTRQPTKNSSKNRKLSLEEQFQREWKRVQTAQKKNAALQEKIADFVTYVEQQIATQEKAYCDALIGQTRRLLTFMSKKSLPDYQRQELDWWVYSNIEEVTANLFNEKTSLAPIIEELRTFHSGNLGNLQKQDSAQPQTQSSTATDEFAEDEENVFEDVADNNSDESYFDESDFFERIFEERGKHEEFARQKEREHAHSLDKLLKSTSINKLFRQLARYLHPDLVQDEEEKAKRHHLMIDLVKARQEKDIIKIVAMYSEHVGEAPHDLFDGDYEQMTLLLKYRVKQLNQEKEAIISENPRNGVLYRRFHRSSSARVKLELHNHLSYLSALTAEINGISANLTSLKKLKPYLLGKVKFDPMREFTDMMFERMKESMTF